MTLKKTEKIAVASRSFSKNPILRSELTALYPHVSFNETGRTLMKEELIGFLQGHDKAITGLEGIDASVLKAVPSLKLISKYGVGLDMIDLKAMDHFGVQLGWMGGVNKRSVAELALAFFLLLVRGIPQSNASLKARHWAQAPGNQLTGKTIGIIGCGNVGQDLVRLLQPFSCPILVNEIKEYPDFFQRFTLQTVSLEELLTRSDIVSLHIPLNASTNNLISQHRIKQMKQGAFLVNTARGNIVDEEALKESLKSKHLAGAAFDVFGVEPPLNPELISLPGFFGTPHIGGSSVEAVLAMGRAAIENLDRGQSPLEFLSQQ